MGMVACPATAWPLSTTCIPTTHQASTRPRAWPPHQASSPSSAATTTVTAAVRPQQPVSDKAPHTHTHVREWPSIWLVEQMKSVCIEVFTSYLFLSYVSIYFVHTLHEDSAHHKNLWNWIELNWVEQEAFIVIVLPEQWNSGLASLARQHQRDSPPRWLFSVTPPASQASGLPPLPTSLCLFITFTCPFPVGAPRQPPATHVHAPLQDNKTLSGWSHI